MTILLCAQIRRSEIAASPKGEIGDDACDAVTIARSKPKWLQLSLTMKWRLHINLRYGL